MVPVGAPVMGDTGMNWGKGTSWGCPVSLDCETGTTCVGEEMGMPCVPSGVCMCGVVADVDWSIN